MGSSIDTVQFICDQAGLGSRLTYKKMFGEYGLYLDDKVIAFVCDDQLFLKPTPEGRAVTGPLPEAQIYPGSKLFPLLSGLLDDPELLARAFEVTASALPAPKPKPAKKAKVKAKAKAKAGAMSTTKARAVAKKKKKAAKKR